MTTDDFYEYLLEIAKAKGTPFPYTAQNAEESLMLQELISKGKIGYGTGGFAGKDSPMMLSVTLHDPQVDLPRF